MISALQDQGVLSQEQLLLLTGNFLRKKGSVASWLGLAGPPWNSGAVGHGWPGDQHHWVTSVAEWNLSFWNLYWIDKRSNELPALEDLGVCCVYFFFIFFVVFGLKPIPRSLVFPQTGNPVSLASCNCSAACLPHCCTFLSWTVVFIWKWKKLKCRCVNLALAHSSFCPLLSK